MNTHFKEIIRQAVDAQWVEEYETIQNLWSGYGKILRYKVTGAKEANIHSVIVKHVRFPQQNKHPRGWNTDISHDRKVRSYEVETEWYKTYNTTCDASCRTPHCYALAQEGDEVLIVLEDLDDSGFAERRNNVTLTDIKVCLKWLAAFHASFVHHVPQGLWESGTYWHLQTRPDELKVLDDAALRQAANSIDKQLNAIKYQSLVHGDAKLANFCFGKDDTGIITVAAVDFQYVGGGCGIKDVAYFIGSCLYEEDCERYETTLLDYYFTQLTFALNEKQPTLDAEEMCQEWRQLYPYAWADFHRFLKGWSPGHWKINSYSERICREVINTINKK